MSKQKRSYLIVGSVILFIGLLGFGIFMYNQGQARSADPVKVTPTPVPPPVNLLELSQRPFVTLQPLSQRNQLELVIHNLPVTADSVEVTLEYDRNKGVLDAVLKEFPLTKIPLVETMFLGSKSAGGHTTYHDDVIGGSLTLKFTGDQAYTLKVPWRYDDTQTEYSELSSADGYFQISLADPIPRSKVVIMQSPGAPAGLPGQLSDSPYLVRTQVDLPDTDATVKLRLKETDPAVSLYGWDGVEWFKLDATSQDKTLTYSGPLYSVYAVTK